MRSTRGRCHPSAKALGRLRPSEVHPDWRPLPFQQVLARSDFQSSAKGPVAQDRMLLLQGSRPAQSETLARQLGCSPDATRIFRLRGFDTDTSDHHLNYCRVLSYEHFPWPVLRRKTTFGSGSGSPFTHMTRTHIGRSENPAVQRSPAVPRRGVSSFEAAAQERGQQRLTSIQNNSDLHQGDQHSYYGLAFARPLQ
jgi:hypothetical protein